MLLFSCLLSCLPVFCLGDDNPHVTIEWGKIKGLYQEIQEKKIAKFIGIPYAEPPVNELRFAKPRAITSKHEGVFDATREPTHCYAMPFKVPTNRKVEVHEAEECLSVTVWTPADSLVGTDLKPVLIYIHGGGFLVDELRFGMIEPDVLSAKGDMVVVTIKYRLGVFGCLFADREDVPGNVLLEDQALGIEWVKDNIKYFGGDPDRITLSGLSAGSISVALHYLNPNVNRLFHRVIMRSGAVQTVSEDSVENAKKRFEVVAKKVSCWTEDNLDETVKCLRQADVDKLRTAYMSSNKIMKLRTLLPSCLVAKGLHSRKEWEKRLFAGESPRNMNALITTMEDEGSILFSFVKMDVRKSMQENFRDIAEVLVPGIKEDEINELVNLYFGTVVSNSTQATTKAMLDLVGDRFFACPSIWFAEQVAEKSTVYTAKYTKMSDSIRKLEPKILFDATFGPKHGADSVYVFGAPFREELKQSFEQEDVDTATRVINFVASFVRDGKVDWSPYYKTIAGDKFPLIYEIQSGKMTSSTKPDPRYLYCQLWKKICYNRIDNSI